MINILPFSFKEMLRANKIDAYDNVALDEESEVENEGFQIHIVPAWKYL